MSDLSVNPSAAAEGARPVDSTGGAEALTWHPVPLRDLPVAGRDAFDRLELSSGASLQQAYAQFTVHPQTGVVSIKIIDAATDHVIREIPSEEVIRIAEQLQAYIKAGKSARA
jgi:hypothetical protein